MRDVSSKYNTLRTAKGVATLRINPATADAIRSGNVPKADPLSVARIAGIQAAKNTSFLIPYCHQVPLDYIGLDISMSKSLITIVSEVKAIWKTGVEMEALVAVSAAALTLYDMLKIIDDQMEILSTRLMEKKGGKSSVKETGEGLTAAVLVMSDSVSKKEKEDVSGKILRKKLAELKMDVVYYETLPDDRAAIEKKLKNLSDNRKVDLVVTSGGTGVSPRDVTPEATLAIIDRRLEGVEEVLRSFGQERIATAMLSRGIVGIRGKTLIVNLPGSPRGVEDGMNAVFPAALHAFRMMSGEGHEAMKNAKFKNKK
jgi:cyclic pyranopterin phosphate synthase